MQRGGKKRKLGYPNSENKRAKSEEPNATGFEQELAKFASTDGSKWLRPPLPSLHASKDDLVFQQLDLDHYIGEHYAGMPGSSVGPVPIARMYGITMEGNSVLCHIHGFVPYFFIPAPSNMKKDDCHAFKDALNKEVIAWNNSNKDNVVQAVLAVDYHKKKKIYGSHEKRKIPFLQITMALPKLIRLAKIILELGFRYNNGPEIDYITYESDIEYEIRFMVDTNVVGCNWIELPAGKYRKRKNKKKTSRCQLEVDVAWNKFISHPCEGEWQKIAPIRILSFDIECAGRKGIFPEAQKDPVIQISNMVIRHGEKEPFIRNVFTLNTCASIIGADVKSYKKEKHLLKEWSNFVNEADPDVITGYNIVNFDLPYLLNRAIALKVAKFPFFGRIKEDKISVSTRKSFYFQSRTYGKREGKVINIAGRVQFDLFHIMQRDYELGSYSLNSVSSHFLHEQKEDVHHSIITDLQAKLKGRRYLISNTCRLDIQ